jgi:hypothetical protein
MTDYNPKSCNALEKPFYAPIEAALRWCGLVAHEDMVLGALNGKLMPELGQFPHWPCLRSNAERIMDAMENGDIVYGRDGRSAPKDDHVAVNRRTVRHKDLKEWMAKHYPETKPAFLFDEIERTTHTAINADSFKALQIDRNALNARLDQAKIWYEEHKKENEILRNELLAANEKLNKLDVIEGKSRTTALQLIGGLVMSTYKMDIHAKRLDQVAEVVEDITRQGINISSETVSKWIKEAAQVIDKPAAKKP